MTGTAPLPAGERCSAHPSRPAVDRCPTCDRPRCGTDAAGLAANGPRPDCPLCATVKEPVVGRPHRQPPGELELLVRAALAGLAVCLLSGPVASQYVESGLFAYVGPFVIGVVSGAASLRAAVTDGRGRLGTRVRAIAAALSVLGVAFGFSLEGSQPLLSGGTLLPYLAAVAGAVLWTVPPRTTPRRTSGQGAGTEA